LKKDPVEGCTENKEITKSDPISKLTPFPISLNTRWPNAEIPIPKGKLRPGGGNSALVVAAEKELVIAFLKPVIEHRFSVTNLERGDVGSKTT